MFKKIITAWAIAICLLGATVTQAATVLLIPESTNDTVGLYSAIDGTYLGDLIGPQDSLSTPINAIQGPDGNVYISDQIGDNISVFSPTGELLRVFPDPANGDVLNNVRGIALRDGVLFATVASGANAGAIARFDPSTGAYLGNFVEGGGSLSSPFDIFFMSDGSALISDITNDSIGLFDQNGVFIRDVLLDTPFPEQIEQLDNGNLIYADFTLGTISEFDLMGNVINECNLGGARGVHGLGNGQVLATNGSGVTSIDMGTCGSTVIRDGISARFIEEFDSSPVPVPAALPLMFGGLVALRVFGRRRRS
ncbi:MAG: hypothetical protein AB8G18_19245 [Gammaproteobacteria bacterium]